MKIHPSNAVGLLAISIVLLVAASTLAEPKADGPGKPLAQQLAELKKQRLKTAQTFNHAVHQAWEAETVTDDQLLDALRKLKNAERAVATSPQEELGILLAHVRELKVIYGKLYPPSAKQSGGEWNEYPNVRLELETAEIELLEFRLRAKL